MNSVEVLTSEAATKKRTYEQQCRERRDRVIAILRGIPEILQEFRRTSLEDVAAYITSQEASVSESMAAKTLEDISIDGEALDDNGTTIQTGIYKGNMYITAARPEEPVRSLPYPDGEAAVVQSPRSVVMQL